MEQIKNARAEDMWRKTPGWVLYEGGRGHGFAERKVKEVALLTVWDGP